MLTTTNAGINITDFQPGFGLTIIGPGCSHE